MDNESLGRFRDYATRLLASATIGGIRLGMLYTTDEQPTVVALRVELTEVEIELERFAAGGIAAFSAFGPTALLGELLDQLDRGQLHTFTEPIHDVPLALDGDSWSYIDWHQEQDARYVQASRSCRRLHDLSNRTQLDRIIAVQSRHTIASLDRLGVKFLGKPARDLRDLIMLIAPWPLSNVRARVEGSRLRLEISAIPGSDPSRVIVNVESHEGDRRLDAGMFEWTRQPIDERTVIYVGVTPLDGVEPTAVNVYYDGVEEVRLQDSGIARGGPVAILFPSERRGRRAASRDRGPANSPATSEDTPATIATLHVEGYRCLHNVTLDITPLTVLVGPNQAGKSTLLDALAVLSAAANGTLYDALVRRRGGLQRVAWRGDGPGLVQLAVDLAEPADPTEMTSAGDEGDEDRGHVAGAPLDRRVIRYDLVFGPVGRPGYEIVSERVFARHDQRWRLVFEAKRGRVTTGPADDRGVLLDPHETLLAQGAARVPEAEIARGALLRTAVYPYFDTGAAWAQPRQIASMRDPAQVEPDRWLSPTGANLASALYRMRESLPARWSQLVDIARLAFPNLDDLRMPPVAPGQVMLRWRDRDTGVEFDASELSDGTLAFLANLCALMQPGCSLVALDEPERSLHPDALYRLLGAARKVSDETAVVLATQSDRLIGFLDDMPESVVVVRAGDRGTELVRPGVRDHEDLAAWLRSFSLADMRHELETWGA